jgi:glutathione S-transferase
MSSSSSSSSSSTAKSTPKLKLTYFAGRGRAEITRWIFAEAGIEFEDNRIEGKDWGKLKDSTPYGQLPLLEVDGVTLAQSSAIERYAARLGGVAGKNDLENAKADSIVEALHDAVKNFMTAAFTKDKDEQAKLFTAYWSGDWVKWGGILEKVLKANNEGKGYFVGDSVTFADLHFGVIAENVVGANKDAFKDFPLLGALAERVQSRDKIAAWIKKRPTTSF